MSDVWSAIPLGTVPPRPRPAPPSSPAEVEDDEGVTTRLSADGLAARAALPPPRHVPTDDEDGPTTRLSSRRLAAHVAAPPVFPAPPGRSPLPVLAGVGLLAVAVAVLVPWPGSGPWVASSPAGLVLLAGVVVLTAPVVVDLVAGRDRSPATLLGLPVLVAAAAGTIAASGSDLAAVLTAQGLGGDRAATGGVVALGLTACLLVGVAGALRRPSVSRRAAGSALFVGVCASTTVAAVAAAVVVLAAPAPDSATVAVVAGAAPSAPSTSSAPSTATASGGSSCPTEAASTLPEPAGVALVVAHDARVHVAVCQGVSGGLYYYGADDRTHLTITLPATRSEDSWIATNNGVTYSITAEHLEITRGAATLAEEDLTAGWTR